MKMMTEGDPNGGSMDGGMSTIELEIEGRIVKCNRQDLIKNSDYFKVMLEGSFLESTQNTIILKDVELEPVNTILKMLWDMDCICGKNLHETMDVARTAGMLMFTKIKDVSTKRILYFLNPDTALKIFHWAKTYDPQWLVNRVKLFLLMEFDIIGGKEQVMYMNLNEVCLYLGNINLQCLSELNVLRTILKWRSRHLEEADQNLMRLLRCVDFKGISETEIMTIISHLDETKDKNLLHVLKFLCAVKLQEDWEELEQNCQFKCRTLLESRQRNREGFPCLVVGTYVEESPVHYTYKRQRKNSQLTTSLLFLDAKTHEINKVLKLTGLECPKLVGFGLVGHKQFIILLGGEYRFGCGDWHNDCCIYDVLKDEWHKTTISAPRRHFQRCVCDDFLYVVGGTGPFRKIQQNILVYDIKRQVWSGPINFPHIVPQFKCCGFNGNLFVLDVNEKCGHLFNRERGAWTTLNILDRDNLITSYNLIFSLFSYKSKLYIKGVNLLEMQLEDSQLTVTSYPLDPLLDCYDIESALCHNILYSILKQEYERDEKTGVNVWLEAFDMDTKKVLYRVQKAPDALVTETSSLNVLSVFNPYLIIDEDVINPSR